MARIAIAALAALALVFAFAACGGDDDAPSDSPTPPGATPAQGEDTPAAEGTPLATSTPLPPRPEPTPVPPSQPIIRVIAGTAEFTPTLGEFQALPQTRFGAHEGVALATIADRVGAPPGATVTISGYRSGAGTVVFYRTTLEESGESGILTVGETGHLTFVMPEVTESQWITAVERITFE